MGTILSQLIYRGGSTSATIHLKTRRNSSISAKLAKTLSKRREEHDKEKYPITFEKIILRLERLHPVLSSIKTNFYQSADSSGQMQMKDVPIVMQSINNIMTSDEVFDLFDFIDVTHSRSIGLKEFLVALCVGYVLNIIPALADGISEQEIQLAISNNPINEQLYSKQEDIKAVVELLVSTYILFDPESKGCINRAVVQRMIDEKRRKNRLDVMFSEDRWNEMGWDKDGNIDFGEFIYAFSSWVDLFED